MKQKARAAREGKAHHDGTQAVLRGPAPPRLLRAVRREIQIAQRVPDVS